MKYNVNNAKKLEEFINKLKYMCYDGNDYYDNEEKISKYIIKKWKPIFKILLIDQLKWKYDKKSFNDIFEYVNWELFKTNIKEQPFNIVEKIYKLLSNVLIFNLNDIINYNTYMKLFYTFYSNKIRRYFYQGFIFERKFNPFIKNNTEPDYILICNSCKTINKNNYNITKNHSHCGYCNICNKFIDGNNYKIIIDKTKLKVLNEYYSHN